jgi:hypothetical protein
MNAITDESRNPSPTRVVVHSIAQGEYLSAVSFVYLSVRYRQGVLLVSSYAGETEPTTFSAFNAFTRAAQKLGPLQRIEVERFAAARYLTAKYL